MKKTLTAVALLAGAVSVYSQGAIAFEDYGATGFGIVLYAQQTPANSPIPVTYGGYTVNEQQGNVSTSVNSFEVNPGNTSYPTPTLLFGSGYDAQLLAAAGAGDALSALAPVGSPVTFFTGGFAGLFNSGGVISLGTAGSAESVALAAWVNNGTAGTASTLAAAQADGYAWGISTVGTINSLGGQQNPPSFLPATVTTFSLGQAVPEPSTIALGVIGASAFLMRLRRKQ